jgi:hypothetical protein
MGMGWSLAIMMGLTALFIMAMMMVAMVVIMIVIMRMTMRGMMRILAFNAHFTMGASADSTHHSTSISLIRNSSPPVIST